MKKLRHLRKSQGLTQQDIADYIGISRPAYTRYETGEREPDNDTLKKLADIFGVTVDYLLDRDSTPLNLPSNLEPASVIYLPIVGKVAAGNGCYAQEDVEGYEAIPAELVRSNHKYVLLRVKGDSMYPQILEGDLVLMQCQTSVDTGSLAVVIIDDEDGVIKKVVYNENQIKLISENPYYPPRVFEGQDMLRVRVVGLVKRIVRNV